MKYDLWLIDNIFQPFAHWFQKMTGKDNFDLAAVSISIGMIITFACDCIVKKYIIYCGFDLYLLLTGILSSYLEQKNYYRENKGRQTLAYNSNRNRFGLKFLRRFFLVMLVTSTVLLIYNFSLTSLKVEALTLGVTLHAHFNACTPLPPQKGKIQQAIKSLGNTLKNEIPKPGGLTPAPSPA